MPFNRTETQSLAWPYAPTKRQFFSSRDLYKTVPYKKHLLPLPYVSRVYTATETFHGSSVTLGGQNYDAANTGVNLYSSYANRGHASFGRFDSVAYGKARSRYLEDVHGGVSSALGAAVAEANEALGMIASRATQLYHLARAVKRRDWSGVKANLRLSSDPTRAYTNHWKYGWNRARQKASDLSAAWLELHFGWVPMIGDIYGAYQVLTRDFNVGHVKATGTSRAIELLFSADSNTRIVIDEVIIRYKMTGSYRITNPNLLLASELGLTNPASVIWEVVPFSFLVDWFTNVGSWLEGFTPELGWDQNLDFCLGRTFEARQTLNYKPTNHGLWQEYKFYGRQFDRVITGGVIPNVSLSVKPLDGLSVTRGATAIALLVGVLNSLKPK